MLELRTDIALPNIRSLKDIMMKKIPFFAIAATSALWLSACAGSTNSPMDTGDRISQRGGQISDYGDAWSAGQQDVKRGAQMVEKSGKSSAHAQKQLVDARAKVTKAEARIRAAEQVKADGERLISDGTTQMKTAEADYTGIRSGPPAIGNAPQN